MAKVTERTYAADKKRVWDALQEIVEARDWTVEAQDPPAGKIAFNTGGSWWSWQGQDMLVALNEEGGGTNVLISGRLARDDEDEESDPNATNLALSGDYVPAPGRQLFSWGEKGRIIKKIYADLDATLGVEGTQPSG